MSDKRRFFLPGFTHLNNYDEMNGKKKQRESRSKGYGKIGKTKMNGMAKKQKHEQ